MKAYTNNQTQHQKTPNQANRQSSTSYLDPVCCLLYTHQSPSGATQHRKCIYLSATAAAAADLTSKNRRNHYRRPSLCQYFRRPTITHLLIPPPFLPCFIPSFNPSIFAFPDSLFNQSTAKQDKPSIWTWLPCKATILPSFCTELFVCSYRGPITA